MVATISTILDRNWYRQVYGGAKYGGVRTRYLWYCGYANIDCQHVFRRVSDGACDCGNDRSAIWLHFWLWHQIWWCLHSLSGSRETAATSTHIGGERSHQEYGAALATTTGAVVVLSLGSIVATISLSKFSYSFNPQKNYFLRGRTVGLINYIVVTGRNLLTWLFGL